SSSAEQPQARARRRRATRPSSLIPLAFAGACALAGTFLVFQHRSEKPADDKEPAPAAPVLPAVKNDPKPAPGTEDGGEEVAVVRGEMWLEQAPSAAMEPVRRAPARQGFASARAIAASSVAPLHSGVGAELVDALDEAERLLNLAASGLALDVTEPFAPRD